MMISTQSVRMSSSHLPQPGLGINQPSPASRFLSFRRVGGLRCSSAFPQGRGNSVSTTSARKLAASASVTSFSSVEADHGAASHAEQVPAHASKDAAGIAVRNGSGIKIEELVDPISRAKFVSTVHDQLPPLLSLVIDGLPPLRQSKYVDEAEQQLREYAKRFPNVKSWYPYCRVGLSTASYGHPEVISLERLVVISLNFALMFVLDDLFFDTPSKHLQNEYGVSSSACESPEKMQEHLDYLDAILHQKVQPSNPTPLETLMWEIGGDTLKLSNIEWFNHYIACIVEHHHANVGSEVDIIEGNDLCFQDLESYTVMRAGNVGGKLIQMMVEFAKDAYIPSTLRANPYLEAVTTATSIHLGFVNDVFSYHKECSIEENPRNLITVLINSEGKSFIQTLHMAISLVNMYAYVIMDLEAKAWNSTLRNHLYDIKGLIAGSIYYSSIETRYRHPDSFFPELKDITSSWKILPHAKV